MARQPALVGALTFATILINLSDSSLITLPQATVTYAGNTAVFQCRRNLTVYSPFMWIARSHLRSLTDIILVGETLACSMDGAGSRSIECTWVDADSLQTVSADRHLRLSEIGHHTYTCTAAYVIGNVTRNLELQVGVTVVPVVDASSGNLATVLGIETSSPTLVATLIVLLITSLACHILSFLAFHLHKRHKRNVADRRMRDAYAHVAAEARESRASRHQYDAIGSRHTGQRQALEATYEELPPEEEPVQFTPVVASAKVASLNSKGLLPLRS